MRRLPRGRRWIVVVVVLVLLSFWSGPALIGIQVATGSYEPGGNCGNNVIEVPNTDLISWRLSGGTSTSFEEACAVHDTCYGTLGQSKHACDWAFWQDMRAGCRESYQTLDAPWLAAQIGQLGCSLQAGTYYAIVSRPLTIMAYCNEQYYTRIGSRAHTPDPLTALMTCGRDH
jgi:hypothetical protein